MIETEPVSTIRLRDWQRRGLELWDEHARRGIFSVVTGGGKTYFALVAIQHASASTPLIIVPTLSLLDQWWEEAAAFFNLGLDEVSILGKRSRLKRGTVNLVVLNTAAAIAEVRDLEPDLLVIDECHRAASPVFRSALRFGGKLTVGLSATPERPYDDGLNEILIPALGPVLLEYGYADALRDKVIVPFELRNVLFDLEPEVEEKYARLSRQLARAIDSDGLESDRVRQLLIRRAQVANVSLNRIEVAARIALRHRGQPTIVFHEHVQSAELMAQVLNAAGAKADVYHSRQPVRRRAAALRDYRNGETNVLVACRALDEGFNVPATEVGIIAASTATRRQRIQRLGRILRPSGRKASAVIYTLSATDSEVKRLLEEEADFGDIASIGWAKA